LFDACESPGPGMLVHPTRGSVMAACRKVKLRERRR
jgi:prophage DNA circulation protein